MTDHSPESLPALVIAGGARNGESLQIETPGVEKLLGSAEDCHLRMGGAGVDPHHAYVVWDESRGVVINDQGSAHGTWVNGERVSSERVLQDGDRVSLGPPGSVDSVKLLVQIPPQLEAPLVLDADEGAVVFGAPERFSLPDDEEVFDATGQEEFPEVILADPVVTEPEPPPPPPPPVAASARPPAPATPAVIFEEAAAPVPGPGRHPTFTDELPSIPVERPRERVRLPPVAPPRPAKASAGPSALLFVGLAAVGLVVLGAGAFVGLRFLRKPAPALTSVVPSRAEPGQSLTITGTGFAEKAEANVVHFGDQRGTVTAATATQLTVVVPASLGAAREVPVTVETGGGRSNALRVPLRIAPRPVALEPDVALPGSEVVIKGHNLDGAKLTVTVARAPAVVREASATAVRFEVPQVESMVEGQDVLVAVQAGGETARPLTLTLGRLPLLTQVDPRRGEAGARVVLRGRGFDPDAAANVVTFGGERALVVAAADRQLDVLVPPVPTPGNNVDAPIVVRARGSVSRTPLDFTLLRPSGGAFLPRFFAAAVSEDPRSVFVSSEAGPLLLLSGPDGSASVAERAQKVAAALNTLFEAGGAPTMEVRGGDPPALAVAGAAQPLVRATAEDAAAYVQPWNAPMKGQRATPAALAAHWAALLQDYLTLFVQRQRPTRVVEVSPRGRVLLELHAEGERRLGRGSGVPAGSLSPPAPTLAAALRELALALPTRGQSVPGAALVGRWDGTMEEAGIGIRSIRLRLRLDGTKLAGSISLSQRPGQVSMDLALKAVSYEKGALTFELASGPTRRFRGTAAGSTFTGTITDQAQKEIGRFTMQYVE